MARFPHYKSNVKTLGKLLAKAAIDPSFCDSFRSNPKKVLTEAGLPPAATELMRFAIVQQTAEKNVVSIPFKLNSDKLRCENSDYLRGIARIVQ